MKWVIYSFSLLLSFSIAFAQPSSQDLVPVGHWDNDNLGSYGGITYNDVWGWWDSTNNREYAIVGALATTYFIDITQPTNPVMVDSVPGTYPLAIHRDVKTYQHYCYGVADEGTNSTLQIIDMSYLPDSVHVVYDTNAWFSRAHNIFIEEARGRMYVVGTRSLWRGVWVFDLTNNPEQPVMIGNQNLGEYTHDLFVLNDTAYLNNGPQGLKVYDFTNPAAPVPIGALPSYAGQGYNHSGWLTEDHSHLVMCDETHNSPVRTVNVTNLGNMYVADEFKSTLLAPADTQSLSHNPIVRGNYAAVSYYHDGVQIFDVSDPNNVTTRAWYDTDTVSTNYNGYKGCWGVYPLLPSGHILGTDVLSGLWVLRPQFPFPTPRSSSTQVADATCAGGSDGTASVSAGGGTGRYTYLWSNGDTTAAVTGLSAGTYTVTTTDQLGYTTVDTVSVGQPTPVMLNATGDNETCAGNGDGSITVAATGGTPGYQYLWSTGDTTANINALPAGNYGLTVTDANGCTEATTVTLTVANPTPVAFAGADSTVCIPDINLNATQPPAGSGIWTLLSGAGNIVSPGNPTSAITGLGPGSNTFVWTVTQGPCSAADTIEITRNVPGVAYAGVDTTICGPTYTMTGLAPGQGSGQWSILTGASTVTQPNNPNSGITNMFPGAHAFIWTVTTGSCEDRDTVSINVQGQPAAGFSYIRSGNTYQFTSTSSGATQFFWDFGDGSTITLQNPNHTFFQQGTFTVCLIASNLCGADTACQVIDFLVGLDPESRPEWQVWPNPASGSVQIAGPATENAICTLIAADGRVMGTWNPIFHSDGEVVRINLPAVAAGIYTIKIHSDRYLFSSRIFIH